MIPNSKTLPRSSEIADATLHRMENGTERGYSILGMQCGMVQATLSASPCHDWLHTPAGKNFRAQFSELMMTFLYASSNDPREVASNKKDFLTGLAAFTQDITGEDIMNKRRPSQG